MVTATLLALIIVLPSIIPGQGPIKPYFSKTMLEEYAGVLAQPRFGFPPDRIEALLALVRGQGEEVRDPEPRFQADDQAAFGRHPPTIISRISLPAACWANPAASARSQVRREARQDAGAVG
jgi:hypothetical protein